MSILLAVDTLDDRREIHGLLAKLAPWDRVRFLARCCQAVHKPGRNNVGPSVFRMRERIEASYRCDKADDGLTNMLYADLLFLAAQWGLDLAQAAVDLERVVKRFHAGVPANV